MKAYLSVPLLALSCVLTLAAQPSRVLVVYNSNSPASQEVADYYRVKRSIPTQNMCPVAFGNELEMFEPEWNTRKAAIRTCLNAASGGASNILYIVMAYRVPFALYGPGSTTARFTAVDGYVADIWDRYSTRMYWQQPTGAHGYYSDAQSQGGVYGPFQSLAAYRSAPRAQMIYSVWRLDGPGGAGVTCPAPAGNNTCLIKAMIDKAFAIENGGGLDAAPGGIAYIDRRYGSVVPGSAPDFNLFSGDQDLRAAGDHFTKAGFSLTEDSADPEIGGGAPITTAPNAMLYSGWYQYATYNNVFTWRDGAVGFHLDSASAQNYRTAGTWAGSAIRNGITVTSGSITEPFLFGLPHPDVVFRNLLQGAKVGDAFLRGTPWLRWNVLNFGDPLYTPFPGGRAPFNVTPLYETSLSLTATGVIGGSSLQGTLRLKDPAPSGGVTFTLSADTATNITLPATVTVAAGQRTSAPFVINTTAVTAPAPRVIRVDQGAQRVAQNTVVLFPLLGAVGVNPSPVTGGASATGEVAFYERAPLGGAVVSLSSSDPVVASVPPTVTVAMGSGLAQFAVVTTPPAVSTIVTITATYQGASVTTTLQVTP